MKVKNSLLTEIMTLESHPKKYSKAYLNLNTVLELEKKEKQLDSTMEKTINEEKKEIDKMYSNFMNSIPLKIVEHYYVKNSHNLRMYAYIEYGENEISDIKYEDIYLKLEEFYNKIFRLTCMLLSQYSVEVKVNTGYDNETSQLI